MKEKGSADKSLIITVVVILAVVAAGYFYVTRDRVVEDPYLLSYPVDQGPTSVDGDLLQTLSQLKRMSFDETIFSDPVFLSLTNFSTVIPSQPAGRQNPFAPLGAASTPFSSSQTAASATSRTTAPPATQTSTGSYNPDDDSDFSTDISY